MTQRIVVIMAGGAGERFWPVSRVDTPKQLLRLTGDKSMLQLTLDRIAPAIGPEQVYILTSQRLAARIRDAFPQLSPRNVIGEPARRNTASCLALALAHTGFDDDAPAMGVLTADHHVENNERFLADVDAAFTEAEKGRDLVTMGIPPAHPDTGFGYVEVGEQTAERNGTTVHDALQFHEKPDAETAQRYLESGNFLWNSGMFFWKNSTLFAAFEKHMPALAESVRRMRQALQDGRSAAADEIFAALESVSIDYGVMEPADNVKCVKTTFVWDDIGTWNAVSRAHQSDADGNTVIGDALPLDTKNTLLYAAGDDAPTIATLGVEDLIVVATKDAVMVCRRDDAQRVKEIVQALKDRGRDELI